MCHFCEIASVEASCSEPGFGSLNASLSQAAAAIPSSDIPDNPRTQAIATVGTPILGMLETRGDEDWYRLSLDEGQTVEIALTGFGDEAVADTVLRIFDTRGRLLENDGNSPKDLDAAITFTAFEAATYFIEVDSFAGRHTGDYFLSVEAPRAPSPVDAILGTTFLDARETVLVYFAEAGDSFDDGSRLLTAEGFNEYERGQLWSIFESVEQIADIDFEITLDRDAADLQLGGADLGEVSLGFFDFPTLDGAGGFGFLNTTEAAGWSDSPGGALERGGFAYGIAVHEIGHALGLAHPHDIGNGTSTLLNVANNRDPGAFDLNQTVFTALSYNNGWLDHPDGAAADGGFGFASGFGTLDIAALQELYGAKDRNAAGNDRYLITDRNEPGTGFEAIWDTGGYDTLQFLGDQDATIDLRAASLDYAEGGGGYVSHAAETFGGFTIANGVEIEAATGGSGDDQITGNDLNNRLIGGEGDDVLAGGNGNDLLIGGAGGDLFDGGEGFDRVSYARAERSVVADLRNIREGRGESAGDSFQGIEQLVGSTHRDFLFGDDAANRLYGGRDDDNLRGGAGADILAGGAGDDMLTGQAGRDLLIGGDGADMFIFNHVSDSGPKRHLRDQVRDFDSDMDLVDLRRVDADALSDGDQAFVGIGASRFSGEAGELRTVEFGGGKSVLISADTDGDRRPDFEVLLVLQNGFDESDLLL